MVEPLKDTVYLILRNSIAIIGHRNAHILVIVTDSDENIATRMSELKGVGQEIHQYLVEVGAVYPHHDRLTVSLQLQVDLPFLGLNLEETHHTLGEGYEVGLRKMHLHLPLVNLAKVRHLIDKVKYALCIALHKGIDILPARVFVLLHQREQRCENQCHRRTYVVTQIDEEAKLAL